MWEIIKAGGPVMWPLLLLSVASFAILIERIWALQPSKIVPSELVSQTRALVRSGHMGPDEIKALAQNSPLGQVLAAGLLNQHRGRGVLKEALEDTGRHVAHELERYLNVLGTIASVAPFIGLLGTVLGIIAAFSAITHSGIGDPKVLSGGIGQALVSTAAGLVVAIPSLLGYRFLRSHVDHLVIAMEKEARKLLTTLEGRGEIRREASKGGAGGSRP
jgi:biopolymer transport protein ExbB